MERPLVGSILVVQFPYSDLSQFKRRPVFVLGYSGFDNLVVCQITSRSYSDTTAIKIAKSDFVGGGLPHISYVRPSKLFTCAPSLILYPVGQLQPTMTDQILSQARGLFTRK